MANRIVGNTLIIEATGDLTFPGGGNDAKILNIAFWSSDSTGRLVLVSQADTSDVIVQLGNPVNDDATVHENYGSGKYFGKLTATVVTAGTGYINFG